MNAGFEEDDYSYRNARKNMDYVKEETATGEGYESKAEWVEPAEGVEIEGLLMRGFLFLDTERNKLTPAYEIHAADGGQWLLGERAAYKQAIRAQKLGSTIKISFAKKIKLKDEKGKTTGKTMWQVDFFSKRDGVGLPVIDELKADYLRHKNKEEVPF